MGILRFRYPTRISADVTGELERAGMAGGYDNMPTASKVTGQGDKLTLRRDVDEGGSLTVPWDVPGAGRVRASSATCIERSEPYRLVLELARGKINQVRNQVEEWRGMGMQIGD